MVYFDSWDEFVDRSVQLFRADPVLVRRDPALPPRFLLPASRSNPSYVCPCVQTRYVMKYRHCDGKLVLKVTDDRVVRRPDFLFCLDLRLFLNS
jgi:signal recognition particle subunit SRP9